jgi:hypothetical protein
MENGGTKGNDGPKEDECDGFQEVLDFSCVGLGWHW